MFGEFKVVHLIGKTEGNEEVFRLIEKELTKKGFIVFRPVFYVIEDYLENRQIIDRMCYEKLIVADIICIVGVDYIGKSTMYRMKQAISMNKEVMIWNDGRMVEYNLSEKE